MRVVKQKTILPIENIEFKEDRSNLKRHGNLLPSTIRCLIVGPSNCGKSNIILNLLLHPNGLKFENIYVYSKSLFQPKYKYLEEIVKPIKGINYYKFDCSENIVPPSEARRNSVFIFDDVVCDKQNVMREYFSMGRHNNIDSFYLCQTYTKIPKQLVRDNANLIVLFEQDQMNLKHVYDNHITDIKYDQFKVLCDECWREKYGFIVIDKENNISGGRYRKGFDCYIFP